MDNFLEALDQRVLVCDGAMGTLLYAKGIFLNRCFDELNLTHPDLVAEVHREYVRAGADVIESNTFGANRVKLVNFGLSDQVERINREAVKIARRVAGDKVWVAGSLGPLGVRLEPWGRTAIADAEDIFREQAIALESAGVDLFILETFRDLSEITAAIRAVRSVSARPIVAQMTTEDDGTTLDGTPPETFAPELQKAGADVIGVNCSVGPAAMLETIEAMARLSSARLSAQPNAGRPRDVEGRNLYLSSPEYLASYARRFTAAGVRLVGGCCGTTPEHIRHIAKAVRHVAAGARRSPIVTIIDVPAEPMAPVARAEKSALARAFVAGQFVVLAEVAPPRGVDLSEAVGHARRFAARGAIAVNVPDYPKSGARASALALAALIEQGQVETLLHCPCRHRDLIGVQSELVGAHAMGVRNVLLTTGSPAQSGSFSDVDSTLDIDAIGLTNIVSRLNRGLDVGGRSLGAPARFHIGVAVNPFAADPDVEWRRLAHKVEAGAEFLVTPPILDVHAFEPALEKILAYGLPVIAGVAALEGLRHAEFLASEVVGVRVAERLIERLRRHAANPAAEANEAIDAAIEIATWLRGRVQGVQITSFHGSTATIERLLSRLTAAGA